MCDLAVGLLWERSTKTVGQPRSCFCKQEKLYRHNICRTDGCIGLKAWPSCLYDCRAYFSLKWPPGSGNTTTEKGIVEVVWFFYLLKQKPQETHANVLAKIDFDIFSVNIEINEVALASYVVGVLQFHLFQYSPRKRQSRFWPVHSLIFARRHAGHHGNRMGFLCKNWPIVKLSAADPHLLCRYQKVWMVWWAGYFVQVV